MWFFIYLNTEGYNILLYWYIYDHTLLTTDQWTRISHLDFWVTIVFIYYYLIPIHVFTGLREKRWLSMVIKHFFINSHLYSIINSAL